MKLKVSDLRKIINEEIRRCLAEARRWDHKTPDEEADKHVLQRLTGYSLEKFPGDFDAALNDAYYTYYSEEAAEPVSSEWKKKLKDYEEKKAAVAAEKSAPVPRRHYPPTSAVGMSGPHGFDVPGPGVRGLGRRPTW